MKLSKILNELEEKYPLKISEEWDNVGLMVGRRNQEIEKILLSLDLTEEVIEEAVEKSVNLIITHHPLIFKPLKNINSDSLLGRKIIKLIENKIAVYSMHTNLDSAKDGLNDFVGEEILGFDNGEILDKQILNDLEFGLGRIYSLKEKQNIKEFALKVKEKLKLDSIKLISNSEEESIKKVALITGAGSSFWRKAKKLGADILITGDIKYHEALNSLEENFNLLDIGHYESEYLFMDLIKKDLENIFDNEIIKFETGRILKNI